MFGNMIKLSEFWARGFGCENVNVSDVKTPINQICLKYEDQLKQKTITREKFYN